MAQNFRSDRIETVNPDSLYPDQLTVPGLDAGNGETAPGTPADRRGDRNRPRAGHDRVGVPEVSLGWFR